MPERLKLYYDVMPSPFGPLWLMAKPEGLAFVMREKAVADVREALYARVGLLPEKNCDALIFWRDALSAYFSGEHIAFKGKISFMVGTPFQQKVWRKLLEIPYGTTRSYQWLAAEVSSPRAFRAVGNACGKNPLPLVVPCHRVVCRDGALGGYTGGIDIKIGLLALEGILVNQRNRPKLG